MFEQPIEEYEQFIDSDGVVYVATKISDNIQPWFDYMIERHGLSNLIQMFPYVTLVIDQRNGLLQPCYPCKYNAKITNNFHIKWAKEMKNKAHELKLNEYSLNLTQYFPKENQPIIRDIGIDTSRLITTQSDLFTPDYNSLPDVVHFSSLPTNWHPNRDSNGNYLSARMSNNQYNYYNIPRYTSSYLPSYRTFTSYPIVR